MLGGQTPYRKTRPSQDSGSGLEKFHISSEKKNNDKKCFSDEHTHAKFSSTSVKKSKRGHRQRHDHKPAETTGKHSIQYSKACKTLDALQIGRSQDENYVEYEPDRTTRQERSRRLQEEPFWKADGGRDC